MIECEACTEEVSEDKLESHVVEKHSTSPAVIREKYSEIYEDNIEAFDNPGGLTDKRDSDEPPESKEEIQEPSEEDPNSHSEEKTTTPEASPSTESSSQETKTENRSNQNPEVIVTRDDETSDDGDSLEDAVDESDGSDEQTGVQVDGFLDESTGREKWFAIGIGGCGGNLVDGLILRAETLRQHEDHPLSNAWEGAIRGLAVVNADANSELASTHFAQEYKQRDASAVADNYKIGPPEVQGSGNVERRGDALAAWTLDQDESDFGGSQWGDALNPYRIDQAQGVMLFHSAVKGTGTGASPTIAKRLNEEVLSSSDDLGLDFVEASSVFSSVILPSIGNLDGIEKRNGLVGMARLANEIDAILPFDNENLRNAPDELRVPIPGTEGYQMANHQAENEMLISFLETMSLTSAAPGDNNPQDTGDQVDVQDIYNPAKDLLPRNQDLPAIILAPVYGHIDPGDTFDSDHLEELVSQALFHGKLVDFDHQTAWGGAFLVAQSGEYGDQISQVGKHNLRDILAKEEYLNFDVDGEGGVIPTSDYYIKIPGIDGVRLCAVLYNPRMPRIESWRDWADSRRGTDNAFGERLTKIWEDVEDLFELLGRENMPGYGAQQ